MKKQLLTMTLILTLTLTCGCYSPIQYMYSDTLHIQEVAIETMNEERGAYRYTGHDSDGAVVFWSDQVFSIGSKVRFTHVQSSNDKL